MVKLFEEELARSERDFKQFLKSRNVTLSKNEVKKMISSKVSKENISLFDTERFRKSIQSGSKKNKVTAIQKMKINLNSK